MISASVTKNGRVENVEITIGTSYRFSIEEIEEAINRIKEKFTAEFKGCELLQLWYEVEGLDHYIERYMRSGRGSRNGVNRENVIVLFSNYKADSSHAGGPFSQNTIYKDWSWILIRDGKKDPWRVDDWGY